MKVGTGGNFGLSKEYHMKLWASILSMVELSFTQLTVSHQLQTKKFLPTTFRATRLNQLVMQDTILSRHVIGKLAIEPLMNKRMDM